MMLALFSGNLLPAQDVQKPDYDTGYYTSFHNDLIFRVFTTRKYHNFEIKKDGTSGLKYLPNNLLNLGVGVSYRGLSLNLAYGFDFINPEKGRVNTNRIDLQSRLYGRKWLIDLSGEFFKGYDLHPKGKFTTGDTGYYARPDLDMIVAGFTAYRLLNSRRLTMRNGFVQDEWQKKSAGSFLIGGGLNYARIKADSTILPTLSLREFNTAELLNLKTWTLSAGIGYAYTLVLPADFYISGAATAQMNLAYVEERYPTNIARKTSLTPAVSPKLSAGYFNGDWHVGAFWVNNRLSSKGAMGSRYVHNTGIFRFVVSKRIPTSKKTKQLLKPVDGLLNIVKEPVDAVVQPEIK